MIEGTFKPEYLVPGTRIGGYEVCDHLGMGSGVVVYDVVSQNGNHYALKVSRFRPGVAGSRGSVMDGRLGRCILCLQHLKGCHYVAQLRAYDRYPDPLDGWQYLVQDLVPGGLPITEWVWRTTPPVAQVIELFRALAETCGRMADLGICHRDLKPSNILVAPDGTLKIVDFNSASYPGVEPLTRSALDQPVTLIYAPPELASAMYQERVYGDAEPFQFLPTGDLHALGCLFYEVLTADHPFDLKDDDERVQLQEIRKKTPPHPHLLNPAVPFPVTKVVMRLLRKSPSDRYQHGEQVAKELRLMLDNLGTDESWQKPFTVPREDDALGPLVLRSGAESPAESPRAEPIAAPTPRPRKTPVPAQVPGPSPSMPAGPASQHVATPRWYHRRRRLAAAAVVLLVAFLLGKGLTLQSPMNHLAKLTTLFGCGFFTACAGLQVRKDGLDWLASCSGEARKAVTNVPLTTDDTSYLRPDFIGPYLVLDSPAKLQRGPNVIRHRFGVEIQPGPVAAEVLLSQPRPSRWVRLHGVAKTLEDGVSVRFDKLVVLERGGKPLPAGERSEFPICALAGQWDNTNWWPGLRVGDKDDPNRAPDSELHPGYVYVTTDELQIRFATEPGACHALNYACPE